MENDFHKKIIDNMHAETQQMEKELDEHEMKIKNLKNSQGFFAKLKKKLFGN
ncbi:MAG: hypothetical protein NUV57_04445 [archaeon]|nr:hypothetical protein [archaeon]